MGCSAIEEEETLLVCNGMPATKGGLFPLIPSDFSNFIDILTYVYIQFVTREIL
jgi:hypothetical protein